MRKVRLGIIGCGVIGTQHLRAASASPLIELVAIADLLEDRRRKAAAEFGVPQVYTDGETLLAESDVEGVVLAVPAGDRVEMPLHALQRGKHVLIEKPVAMNIEMLRRYRDAQGDRIAGCSSSRYQALPSTQAAADLVASGALGTLRTVHCRIMVAAGPSPTNMPPPWRLSRARNAGGILCNWGCYDMDYLMAITGWKLIPKTVLAQTWGVPETFAANVAPGSDAESHYSAFIVCEGGTVITMERGEYMASAAEAEWRIVGDKGTLRLVMYRTRVETLYLDQADAKEGVVSRAFWEDKEDFGLLHTGPITDFAAAISEGRAPRTDLRRVAVLQHITDAIYASAASGKAVEIVYREDERPCV
jgi:predicted dehydrogenase